MEESLREMDVKLSDVLGHRSAGSSQSELVTVPGYTGECPDYMDVDLRDSENEIEGAETAARVFTYNDNRSVEEGKR